MNLVVNDLSLHPHAEAANHQPTGEVNLNLPKALLWID